MRTHSHKNYYESFFYWYLSLFFMCVHRMSLYAIRVRGHFLITAYFFFFLYYQMNERMHHAAVLHFMNPVRPTDWLSQDRDEFITERNFSKVPISCNVLLSVTNNTFFFYDFFSCFFFFLAEKRTSKQNLCLHIVFFFD